MFFFFPDDDAYVRATAVHCLVVVHTRVGVPDLLHVLPPLGFAGCCADYDEDCYFMPSWDRLPRAAWEWRWARCHDLDPERGPCPFID